MNEVIVNSFKFFGFDITQLKKYSYNEACQILEFWKKQIKKVYKQKSKEIHPDVGGDLEKMKNLNKLYDFVCKVKIMEKKSIRPVIIVRFGGVMFSWSNVFDSSSTMAGNVYSTYKGFANA